MDFEVEPKPIRWVLAPGKRGRGQTGTARRFPDPASLSMAEGWRTGAVKALERQFAGFVPESAAILV